MEISKNKLLLISLAAVAGIIGIVAYSVFQSFTSHPSGGHGFCPRMVPIYILWVSLVLMIIIIVPISYLVVSRRLEEKMEKNLSAITKLIDHPRKVESPLHGQGSILKLLNINEKKVIEKIIENKGSAFQSEVSRMDGMTKLKAHRAVKGLERKCIVRLEQYGKTNKIILSKDIQEVLMEPPKSKLRFH